jgi:hypothetical protein
MFVNTGTALRIERAEAEMTRATVSAIAGSGRAQAAFARALDDGVAGFVRVGSPMNKIIGAGFAAPIDEGALAEVEETLRVHGEPVRIELATLAAPQSGARLTERGYRLLGFENVLARPLSSAPAPPADVRIERATAATAKSWKETLVEGFACSDESGQEVDAFSRDAIAVVMDDVLLAPGYDRYLAWVGDVLAGAAGMRLHEGVAILTGAATLPAQRRRGVQTALIASRLAEAAARGAELAVVTTAPGSQSQANMMKHGFALGYSRAILTRP